MSIIRIAAVILTMILFIGIGLYFTAFVAANNGNLSAKTLISDVDSLQKDININIKKENKKSKNPPSTPAAAKVQPSETAAALEKQNSVNPSKTAAAAQEKSIEDIATIKSNIVVVMCGNNLGSGVAYSTDGYILTNYHVISTKQPCFVAFEDQSKPNGIGDKIPAKVIKFDKNKDLALLKIEKSLDKSIPFGDSDALKAGEKIVTIGNPDGLVNTVADGIVSNTRRQKNVTLIQITSPITHGSSGGALLNMRGELVGITSSGIESTGNLNFAISSKDVKAFLNSN